MDNYIVSARKYRPSTFQSVVGQKALTITLKNAIQNNKLAHAYLFCGPRGVGKTSCARIFAKTINCLTPTSEGEACNSCESCQAFNEQRSYNIHELDAASNNSVEDIRSLIEQVRIPPAIGKYKVFIIDEVHMLSSAAFNAFLKTLEEPPQHALFILATTEKHKVLPTILSRCQIYDFSRISIADMVEHLQYVAVQEGAVAEPEALNVIARKADGGMRDALSIFDQVISFTNGQITYKAVIDNLNVLDYEYYFRLTEDILAGNVRNALLILNEITQKGFDGQNFITGLASYFRDLLVCKDASTLVLFEVGSPIRDRYIELAKKCSDPLLFQAIKLTNDCDINYRISRNKQLLLELTLIQLCQLNQLEGIVDDDKKKRIIKPLGQNESTQQATPSAKQETQPTIKTQTVTTQIPVMPPQAKPPITASAKKNARTPVNISIKTKGDQPEIDEVASSQPQVETDKVSAFTEAALIESWHTYAETLEEKIYLKNTMVNNNPALKEDFLYEVTVHNPGQQNELLANAAEILTFLRDNLNNTRIQMRIRIDETNEKKRAVTALEKYEHLRDINPLIDTLREEFNLRLD
jgi:DNA polymerase-3 subunit gamma/tau